MKMIKPIILLFLVSILCISSCKKSTEPTNPLIDKRLELVPLKIGNSWTSKITTYDTLGTVKWIDTLIIYIKGDTIINGTVWYLEGLYNPTNSQIFYRNDNAGYHITNFNGYDVDYPYPGNIGDQINGMSIVSTDTIEQTPMGQLHCYLYRAYFYGYPYYFFFAPGIGLVHKDLPMKPLNSNNVFLIQISDIISANIK